MKELLRIAKRDLQSVKIFIERRLIIDCHVTITMNFLNIIETITMTLMLTTKT